MGVANSDRKIYTGEALRTLVEDVNGLKKRDCYAELQKYLNHPRTNRVFSFCGLRRTGKTTMVAQAIHDMDPVGFSKSCFIAANKYNSMEELDADLNSLGKQGYKYFFIDEITALPDFIRKSA